MLVGNTYPGATTVPKNLIGYRISFPKQYSAWDMDILETNENALQMKMNSLVNLLCRVYGVEIKSDMEPELVPIYSFSNQKE